ncbi:MAG: type IX secretion system membrane protein PorP/SprF [Bacteroidales bacterium]|nr:type IX secretion system membrane protein PorP/SprF [Bacteroidales bacterium]
MQKIIITIVILSGLLFTNSLYSQQDPMFSQYMFNTLSVNPAYAGSAGCITTSLISRHQWLGLDGAPQTQTFVVHAPMKKQIGVGASIIRDQVGPVRNFSFQGNASYHLQIDDNNLLYFGLMAGINSANFNFTSVEGVNTDDVSFQQNFKAVKPIFGFGLYYRHPKAYAGFSIPNLVETNYLGENAEWEHKRHFFAIAGYVMDINDDFKLRPTATLRYTKNSPLSAEVTGTVILKDLLWVGLLYRVGDAAGALLCLQVNRQVRVGYSYDYSLNVLRGHQSGSHEIMLSYDFNNFPKKFASPRYF